MIEKGLKVGDVFEDGGLFYVVDKIVGSGYISHMISKEEKQAEPETPVKKPASQKRTYKKRGQ